MRRVLSGVAGLFAGLLLVFGAPLTAALVLLGGLAARLGRPGLGLLLLGAPAILSALYEYPARVDELSARVSRHGPGSLSQRDCASIWVLHLGMAMGGTLCGFPEVAGETLGLLFPHGPVHVPSSFPMGAAAIESTVRQWQQSPRVRSRTIALPYVADHGELRRALALTPVTLRGRPTAQGLQLEAEVDVNYPPRASLLLFRGPFGPIYVHEGLYHALEERGWLFPYRAIWTWRVVGSPAPS
jgi:hypothetical protein